jgi:molybdopterin-binding protein
VIASLGFGDFFRPEFVERFVKQGNFRTAWTGPVHPAFEKAGFRDPDGWYTIYSVWPYVLLIDKKKLGNRPVPRLWSDLLDPQYQDDIITNGSRDNRVAEVPLLYFFKDHGEVILTVSDHDQVAAIITNESVAGLGLKIGGAAYAILKASSIIVGVEVEPAKLSARNVLSGKIVKVVTGAVNDEVDIALPGGRTLSAIITKVSAEKLGLKEGLQVSAIFKASAVIIGVD